MDTGHFCYYVVRRGRKPGIYTSWEECNRQVFGFKESEYKGFMDLVVRFGELKVGESVSVAGDGSSRSGTAATNLFLRELDIAPNFDPNSFVIMEDMEQLLFRVCAQLQIDKAGCRLHHFGELLEEAEVKIFDFNYQVALRYKEEVAEAQRLARMSVPERVMTLEKENAELKHRL
ncbi:hypothetical protein Ahy_B05g076389 [Arachis hypogaea]|uniref:Ribonuclease H n=1 Tax=Arachis hypogaea TaxID=3818 RepID=A0A444Z369_ARAHY|nr:hypothetical protein Ahy_B05g076389 [Arachis hypogaea]